MERHVYFKFLLYLDSGETVVQFLHQSYDFKLIKYTNSVNIGTIKHLLQPRAGLHHQGQQSSLNIIIIRLHHYHGEDYCFCHSYYSYYYYSFFLSFQTKFSGQTRNLYRYGPQVDLRTLAQFQ